MKDIARHLRTIQRKIIRLNRREAAIEAQSVNHQLANTVEPENITDSKSKRGQKPSLTKMKVPTYH